jgi:cytochrome c
VSSTRPPRSIVVLVALAAFAAFLAFVAPACTDEAAARAATVTGGSPSRGKDEIRRRGCGSCHTIPGVPGAHALAGPPLDHMASRAYVAGMLPNTADNLRAWIMHPQRIKPNNAMPDVGLSETDARDITAYLYTLE